MTYSNRSPILGVGKSTPDQIDAFIAKRGRSFAGDAYVPPPARLGQVIHVVARHWPYAVNHDLLTAQIVHETGGWQSEYARERNNPSGLGAINADPDQAIWFETPTEGILATVAHLLTYIVGPGAWTEYDPRAAATPPGWLGSVTVLRELEQKWAFTPWPKYSATPEGQRYGAKIATLANLLLETTGDTPMILTETIAQRIRDKGREVHDIRDQMVKHPTLRYDRLPNSDWLYTGVHHTAVSRGVRGLDGDIGSWRNHSAYHVNTHGWPGIAYAIGVSLSGRVFMLRDIEEEGYHAFNANANTIGIAGDLTTGNTITAEFKASLQAVLEVLHESPEFPNLKDRAGTYGHQELAFIDSRNSGTSCPGDLLPLVQSYRAGDTSGGDPDGPPALPKAVPDPYRDDNPYGKNYWVLKVFADEIDQQAWMLTGYCVSEAFAESNLIVQYFERARLEWDGRSVTRGLVGREAMVARYPDRAA